MQSSVLIFDHPKPEEISIGADFLSSQESINAAELENRKVVVLGKESFGILESIAKSSSQTQVIIVGDQIRSETLRDYSSLVPIFALSNDWNDELETLIQKAVDFSASDEIDKQLDALAASEHEQLKSLSSELEETVQRREKNLQRAQKRIMTINRQVESLLLALQAVHQANSVAEVERLILEALSKDLDLSFARVLFSDNSTVESQLDRHHEMKTVKVSLLVGTRILGKIIFGKIGPNFSKQEEEFLGQVAEGVALAIDRLTKLEQAEQLKRQWESTFDSISEPLCLTDTEFKIIKTNRAFADVTGQDFSKLIGKNCFQAFVGKDSTPQIMQASRLKVERVNQFGEKKSFEIHTQQIGVNTESKFLMVMFRDITDQQKIERQIFESAKMAELGTVGSSIAHELNNPLGGMISFLQLIKMDLKDGDAIKDDITQMEAAGKRCKEIIENLLGFSRSQSSLEDSSCDLNRVIEQTLKLAELKSRSAGITVDVKAPGTQTRVNANPNLLAQALNHIFQNCLDAIEAKSELDPRFRGRIDVEVQNSGTQSEIHIRDNGIGIDKPDLPKVLNPLFTTKGKRYSGLGLTLAYKIIDEHDGALDISSQPKLGTEVKISLHNV